MDYVKAIDAGMLYSMAANAYGSLYVWGRGCGGYPPANNYGNYSGYSGNYSYYNYNSKNYSYGIYGTETETAAETTTESETAANDITTPQALSLNYVAEISAGNGYNTAVNSAGSLYAWGEGYADEEETETEEETEETTYSYWQYYQSYQSSVYDSTNTNTNTDTPQKITDGIKSVSTGYSHSLAIGENGSLYVWGSNEYGQLGDGTYKDKTEPKKITGN
ncbi:MAG: hypothetical protein LUD77_02670 [Clostridiales bacterium]|nr:hypothetical protein [Clostridiales bacterium]